MKWFISSLTKHDFLLAAMIVCLDLHYDAVSEIMPTRPPNFDMYFWTPSQKAEMLQALESSMQIWKGSAESSMEAYKASSILGIILEKLKVSKNKAAAGPTTAEVFAQFDDENLQPEQSAAMTLGMLSGGLSPNTAAIFNSVSESPGGTRYSHVDMNMGNSSSSGTGMTPNFPMDMSNPFGINSVASPFSVFGNAQSGAGMMDVPANLDWVCYKSPPQINACRQIRYLKDDFTDDLTGSLGFVYPEWKCYRSTVPILSCADGSDAADCS